MNKQIVGLEITTEILTDKISNDVAKQLLVDIENKISDMIEETYKELKCIGGKGSFMYLGDKIKIRSENNEV